MLALLGGTHEEGLPKARRVKIKNNGEGVDDKRAELNGGQLNTVFMSLVDVPSETDFSELGEDDEIT